MPFLNDAADALEFPPPPPEVLNGNGRGETLTGLEEHRPEGPFGLSDYEAVIGRERVDELKRLAEPLTGRGWVNVNSTAVGGGVAEMLRSVVPLAQLLGVGARSSVQVRQWGPRGSRLLARDEGLSHVPAEPPAAAIFSLQFVQTFLSYWKF